MNKIRVNKLPECPDGGGMTYSQGGNSATVTIGAEYDLSLGGSFGW